MTRGVRWSVWDSDGVKAAVMRLKKAVEKEVPHHPLPAAKRPGFVPVPGDPWTTGETIGQRIRSRRLALGIRQEDIGRVCGVSRTQIVNLESGRTGVSVRRLLDIAKELRVPVCWLLGAPCENHEPPKEAPCED